MAAQDTIPYTIPEVVLSDRILKEINSAFSSPYLLNKKSVDLRKTTAKSFAILTELVKDHQAGNYGVQPTAKEMGHSVMKVRNT